MQALKDNLPSLGIGIAAVAIAGYIAFGGNPDKKKDKKSVSKKIEEVIEEVELALELEFFFLL